ncbi:hypothetical protein [Bacillus thuringiensis]|uniref:Uncharacterized protein n=1 Tax=Bacillus thuringiensis TaxID=1428 RepID=A0A9X6THW3_BACTU|nr:hypothetical protein [Bacillus thuringiensis]PEA86549.1 hypothetical protein CON71_29300 [Bacillus thuringiensis]
MDYTRNLSLATRDNYSLETWWHNGIHWVHWGGVWGSATTNHIKKQYWNFEKAPGLGVDPHRNISPLKAMDIDKLNPKDYYALTSYAGEVKSEFVKKPDPNIIGEQTTTIRV